MELAGTAADLQAIAVAMGALLMLVALPALAWLATGRKAPTLVRPALDGGDRHRGRCRGVVWLAVVDGSFWHC